MASSIFNYAKAFGQRAKMEGLPRLSNTQLLRYMNIVYQTGRIDGTMKCCKLLEGTEVVAKLDFQRYQEHKKLTELTGNIDPDRLLKEMLSFSERDF